uniref:Uncharacterized protein n=1 Tax=Arundo donax TaxID=35708 RepID=A0A0A9CAV8_ARUDO
MRDTGEKFPEVLGGTSLKTMIIKMSLYLQ